MQMLIQTNPIMTHTRVKHLITLRPINTPAVNTLHEKQQQNCKAAILTFSLRKYYMLPLNINRNTFSLWSVRTLFLTARAELDWTDWRMRIFVRNVYYSRGSIGYLVQSCKFLKILYK